MCCLKYEQGFTRELIRITPKVGAIVKTSAGKGVVVESNVLKGLLKVRLDATPDVVPKVYTRDEVSLIKDSRITLAKGRKSFRSSSKNIDKNTKNRCIFL
jgi:cell fate regulator YaaT (PSP1 superfamily)